MTQVLIALAVLGATLLIGGFAVFVQAAPQWQRDQSALAQVASALSPRVRDQMATNRLEYFGSIGGMILGSMLVITGILGYLLRREA